MGDLQKVRRARAGRGGEGLARDGRPGWGARELRGGLCQGWQEGVQVYGRQAVLALAPGHRQPMHTSVVAPALSR